MNSRNLVSCIGLALLASALVVSGRDGERGTEDAKSLPKDPQWITGSSGLSVNVKDCITNIYFDDDYIGTLAPGVTRTWNVPPGEHTVRFTNAEKDNQLPVSKKLEFKENETLPICVTWQKDDHSLYVSH